MRIRGLYLLLAGTALIAAILIVGAQVAVRNEQIARRQQQVKRDLEAYAELGLMRNPLVDDPRKRFVVPSSSVNYEGGRSIGEVMAEVGSFLGAKESTIEQRLSFREFVTHVASFFLRDSRFAGRVQINQPPREGYVNLYFLREDPRHLARYFKSNCSYIGYQSAILCDADFISSYLARFEQISKNYDVLIFEFREGNTRNFQVSHQGNLDRVRSLLQQNFLTWVIGHEVGHAVLHEQQVIRQRSDSHFDLHYSEIEKQADSFVAERAVVNSALGSQFFILLSEFLEQEFRQIYRQQHPGQKLAEVEDNFLTQRTKLPVAYSRYRVPMILRAVRVLGRLRTSDPAIGSSGYMGKFGSYVVFIQSLSEGRERSVAENILLSHPAQNPLSASQIMAILFIVAVIAIFIIMRMNKETQEEL